MLNFSPTEIEQVALKQAEQNQSSSRGGGDFLRLYSDLKPNEDGSPAHYYFKIIVPNGVLDYYTHPVTGARKGVMPYIPIQTRNAVKPGSDFNDGGETFYKREFGVISPVSSRQSFHMGENQCPLQSYLSQTLKDELGFYGGPEESAAVVAFRQSLRWKAGKDWNAPSKDSSLYTKKIAELKKRHPKATEKQLAEWAQRVRYPFQVKGENWWMMITQVGSELVEKDGKLYSEPLDSPKILSIDKKDFMKQFGLIVTFNKQRERVFPYPKSLADRAMQAANDPKTAKAQGEAPDLLSRLALDQESASKGGDLATYDLIVTVSPGAERKVEYMFNYRKHEGKPMATEIHPDFMFDWEEDMPDMIKYLENGMKKIDKAIDGYKVIFGKMGLTEYQEIWEEGASTESEASTEGTSTSDLPTDDSDDDLLGADDLDTENFEEEETAALVGEDDVDPDDLLGADEETVPEASEKTEVQLKIEATLAELSDLGVATPEFEEDASDEDVLEDLKYALRKAKRGNKKARAR